MGNLAILFIAFLAVSIITVEGVPKRKWGEEDSQGQSSEPNTDLSLTLTNVDEKEAADELERYKDTDEKEEKKRKKEEEQIRKKEKREREREEYDLWKAEQMRRKEEEQNRKIEEQIRRIEEQERKKEEREREREEIERRKERRALLIAENQLKKNERKAERRREKKAQELASAENAQEKQRTIGEGSSDATNTGSMGNNVSIAAPATASMGTPAPPFSSLPPSYPVFSSWFSSSPSPAPSNFEDDAENPPQPINLQPTVTSSMENSPLSFTVTPSGSEIGNPVPDLAATDSMGPPALPFSSLPLYPISSTWVSPSPSLSSSWFFSSTPSNFDGNDRNPPQPTRVSGDPTGDSYRNFGGVTLKMEDVPPKKRNLATDTSSMGNPVSIPANANRVFEEPTGDSYRTFGGDTYTMEELPPKKRNSAPATGSMGKTVSIPANATPVSGDPTGNSFRNFGGVTLKMEDVPPKKRNLAPTTGLMRNPADSSPAADTGSMGPLASPFSLPPRYPVFSSWFNETSA